jgi:pilus assembly protein CpaF
MNIKPLNNLEIIMNSDSILTALGPLARYYTGPYDTIVVDAPNRIYVHDPNGVEVEEAQVQYDSVEALRQVIDDLMKLGGITLTPANPTGEVRLPDGARVTAVIPPTAVNSPYFVIQKIPDHSAFTWDNLIQWTTLTDEVVQLFQDALHLWTNILVVGDLRNPKNYLLNLLANSIDPKERVIVVAESHTLPVARQPRCIHLEPGGPAKLMVSQLLEVAARMSPNWLVLGDLQGPEAFQAIQLMKSGYPTLTTLCADSPEDALAQIEIMGLRSNPSLGLMEIRQMIASAFGLVVFLKTHALPEQRIRITQLVEVCGLENDRYVLQPLFVYDNENGVLKLTDAGKTWVERKRAKWTNG